MFLRSILRIKDFELRAFVYDGRVTAITQYNPFIYFPALVARKEVINLLFVLYKHIDIELFEIILLKAGRTNCR